MFFTDRTKISEINKMLVVIVGNINKIRLFFVFNVFLLKVLSRNNH